MSAEPIEKLIKRSEGKQLEYKRDLSSARLREHIGLKHRASFHNHYLVSALRAGFIEQTRADIPNSCLQKYRLTPAGSQILKDAQ